MEEVEKVEEEKKEVEEEKAEEKKGVEEVKSDNSKEVDETEMITVDPGHAHCLKCGNTWRLRSLTPGKKKCPVCGSQKVIANIEKPKVVKKDEKKEKFEIKKKEEKKEKEEKKDFRGWLWAMLGFVAVSAFLAVYFLKSNRGQDRRKDDEGAFPDKGGYRYYIPGLR